MLLYAMFKRHDWLLFTLLLILSVIGIFTLLSTNISTEGIVIFQGIVSRQTAFILIGLLVYFIASAIDLTYLKYPQVVIPVYIFTNLLLLYLLIWGDSINNVKRWLIIGGVQLQPSEIAKITLILCTASILSIYKDSHSLAKGFIAMLVSAPILILIYLEPHGSMTLISLFIVLALLFTYLEEQLRNVVMILISAFMFFGILLVFNYSNGIGFVLILVSLILSIYSFFAKETWKKITGFFLFLGVFVGVVGLLTWNSILKDYQKDRIEAFFSSEAVDDDQIFNVRQSKIAIGSGGLFGKGFGYGTQSRLQYLPEHQTDFIFATFAEQYGFVGSLVLFSMYIFIIVKLFLLSMSILDNDLYCSIIVFGIAVKLLLEVFINIGTNTGVIPATGIPLPLMSAGGSNVIITFFSFGLIQSIISHRKQDRSTFSSVDNDELLI